MQFLKFGSKNMNLNCNKYHQVLFQKGFSNSFWSAIRDHFFLMSHSIYVLKYFNSFPILQLLSHFCFKLHFPKYWNVDHVLIYLLFPCFFSSVNYLFTSLSHTYIETYASLTIAFRISLLKTVTFCHVAFLCWFCEAFAI